MKNEHPAMWRTFIRPAMIFIPFGLGILFPQANVLTGEPYHLVRWGLMIMVFLSCLQLRFAELKFRREHAVILLLNLLMGMVPYFTLRLLLPDKPAYALAAFFVGITPTATAAPVVISFLNGRVGFALTGFTVTNIGISLSLLVLLPWVCGNLSPDFVIGVAKTLFLLIAVPFLSALLVRRVWPGARELPKKCKTFSFSIWSFMLFLLASVACQYFKDHPDESIWNVLTVATLSLLICAMNFTLGHYFARHRFSRESSQILGQKNTTFTMFLALHYAGAFVAMGPITYILWHNIWNAIQMYLYDRRRFHRARRFGERAEQSVPIHRR